MATKLKFFKVPGGVYEEPSKSEFSEFVSPSDTGGLGDRIPRKPTFRRTIEKNQVAVMQNIMPVDQKVTSRKITSRNRRK